MITEVTRYRGQNGLVSKTEALALSRDQELGFSGAVTEITMFQTSDGACFLEKETAENWQHGQIGDTPKNNAVTNASKVQEIADNIEGYDYEETSSWSWED